MCRFFRILPILFLLFCTCCTASDTGSAPSLHLSDYEQTIAQLHITTDAYDIAAPVSSNNSSVDTINYTPQYGMWFTVGDYPELFRLTDRADFSDAVAKRFQQAASIGVNTVYVHVRAFADAYYPSDYFSAGLAMPDNLDFDPLAVMIEAAHELSLSFHAWLNPLRCQTEEQMQVMSDRFPVKQWYLDDEKNGTCLVQVDDRYWLNPAYPEVRQLIADGAAEIVQRYPVDGIHIDDYFYPTTDPSFDEAAFQASGSTDRLQFRKDQCSAMVQQLYQAVKAENPQVLFGISPQGTLRGNETQCSDVQTWCRTDGCCDYIVPQIYFGLQNETAPFAETVDLWQNMVTNPDIQLVIGICTYKIGKEDAYAGSGKLEWIQDKAVSSKELQLVTQRQLGAALYSYASTFQPEEENAAFMENEVAAFCQLLT